MGITPSGFDFLTSVMPHHPADLPALRVLELGNQHFHDANGGLMQRNGSHVAKMWFEANGIEHASIDLNGQDGALPRDICSDLSDLGQFDIVTNFGSSEHVDDQEACFHAFHKLCKPDGLIVHSAPLVGHWKGHCRYRYSITFFAMLAALNGDGMARQTHIDRECGEGRHLIHAAFRKHDDRDQFVFPASELEEG